MKQFKLFRAMLIKVDTQQALFSILLLGLSAPVSLALADSSKELPEEKVQILDPAQAWIQDPKATPFYLVMDKQKSELTARTYTADAQVIRKFRAISGSNPGDKMVEGDKRTPEGIYFVERRMPEYRLQSIHGAAGFELNYPNTIDRILKRTGSGIWIHGVDSASRLERGFDTLGCVALGNDEVLELGQFLRARQTPIVIVDSQENQPYIGFASSDSPIGQRIIEWVTAWASDDVDHYLSFYDPNFYSEGRDYAAFKAHKRRLAKQYKDIQVRVKDLRILRHGKYSVAVFAQHYISDRYEWIGYKRLYLVEDEETSQYRILAENSLQGRSGEPGTLGINFESFGEAQLSTTLADHIIERRRSGASTSL